MDKYKELREAIETVTPQDFDSAEVKTGGDGDYVECPVCCGDGALEYISDYCNYDSAALGVQFYGIGQEHVSAEAYYRAANPATIADLIAERDALSEKYHDLLYQVQTKHPNESRHETAKRLINKAENACNGPEAAKRQEGV